MQLSQSQLDEFSQYGFLIIHDMYAAEDIEAVLRGVYCVIGEVMARHEFVDTRPNFSTENFDVGFIELIQKNRSWGGEVYDLVKEIPAFSRLISHQVHEHLMRQLRPGSMPGLIAGGSGIRIDNPNEDKYRAMWHQEYPAQLKSLSTPE